MRTNKLTRPDGKVDVGILERKFAEKLKTEGVCQAVNCQYHLIMTVSLC